jgi:hypothetical protein
MLAEFDTADALIAAANRTREAGYTKIDGHTPYPVGEVCDAIGFPRSEIGAVMFIGGLVGATMGFLMLTWVSWVEYPLNIAGKPYFSWSMFIPITWELLVLSASVSGVIGLLALCGLPMPYHPLFNVPAFARATKDGFFLSIEATDPKFDLVQTKAFLKILPDVKSVEEVPA